MRVPFVDLQAQYRPIRDDVLAAIARVCDDQRFILGADVDVLERELASMLDVRYAIGVSSGTDALQVALMAVGVGPGAEVVTTPFSFVATAASVVRVGARPVFADVDPQTFAIDASAVQRAITPRTRAIIPVHLYGLPADMDALLEVAAPCGVAVIEDAAQAIGARYNGRQAGTLGTIACFSFFPTKNLGAFGDAGLVTTDDATLAAKVRLLRTHGSERKYYHRTIGGNFRLDALQAAVLRVKAPHLAQWTEARRANAATYARLFAERGLTSVIELPREPKGYRHVYHQYVIRAPRRDELRVYLADAGISTEVHYPLPLHLQECFAYLGHRPGDLPEAERAASEVLALPIFGELTAGQLEHVVDSIDRFYGEERWHASEAGAAAFRPPASRLAPARGGS